MSFRDNERVRQCIESLAQLLSPRPTSSSDIDRIIRYLRPASNSSTEHVRVIKDTIRRSILTHPTSGSDALIVQDKFDKECLQLNYRLLNSFLALLKPLSHHVESYHNTISSYNENNSKSDDFYRSTNNSITNKDARFLSKPDTSSSYSASIQYTPVVDDNIRNKRDDGDHSEYSALVETGSMWTPPVVELRLITDLIYVFQGVGGKHIKYDSRSESYVIDPALRLNSTVRDMTLCLCELGWLYGRVMDYVGRVSAVPNVDSSAENKGLVVQAFGFSLQEELHDYYRLLAVLEQEAKRTLITLTDGVSISPVDRDHPSRGRPLQVIDRHSSGGDKSSVEMEMDDQTGGTSGLTLLRLKAWMQEPIERMCLLARLVDSAGPLSGGALASRLHFFSRHGDGGANILIQRVMYSVCVPLYSILTRWLLHGELNDQHAEFFIGMHQSSSTSGGSGAVGSSGNSLFAPIRNVWKDTYFLRPPMLPTFLSSLLAHKILVIGKSINFIKLCIQRLPKKDATDTTKERADGNAKKNKRRSLREINRSKKLTTGGRVAEDVQGTQSMDEGDSDNDMESAIDVPVSSAVAVTTGGRLPARAHDILSDITTKEVEAALLALKYGRELHLSELVSSLSPAIDMRLLSLLRSRFHVEAHFSALKKFMLLGQGDFVTCLMDGVGPELKKRATQLFRHNLTGILEGAIRSSNAQYEPSYITDRIGVRLLEAAPGDSGWEIFSLDYSIDSPLNAVVHSENMAKYRIAFHMLWRLKRVEWSLAIAWKQLTSFSHINRLEISRPLKVVFHKCTLHRARMMHVVTNLAAFLMFEVMESAWVTLGDKVRGASCLDEVVAAHDAYLSEVLDKALLAPHHEQLNVLVQALLQSILRFCSLEDILIADVSASINARRVAFNVAEERSRRGEWGEEATPSDYTSSNDTGKYDGVPVQVIQRLEDEVSTYNGLFDALMTKLREQGEVTGEILRFLTFRLDFNDYHTMQNADNTSRSPGRTVGVSPMTHQTAASGAGGRGGTAFTFPNSEFAVGGRSRQNVAIQLDQDYSPSK